VQRQGGRSYSTEEVEFWCVEQGYEYGMFHQRIEEGHQEVEAPDHWLRDGNPWEIERSQDTRTIKLYGHTQRSQNAEGKVFHDLLAVPFDMPIPGYKKTKQSTRG